MRRNTRTPSYTHPTAHTGTHTTGSVSTHCADNEQSVSHIGGTWVERVLAGRSLPKAGTPAWDKFVKAWRKWYADNGANEQYRLGKVHVESQGYHVHEMPEHGRISINKTEMKPTGVGTGEVEFNLVPELVS